MKKIRETCMPRGKFKRRYWFFAATPNTAGNCSIIWKDLWWRADSYRLLKYRGGCTVQYRCYNEGYYVKSISQPDTMPLFENSFCLLNNRNRVRWRVLGLSHDGACTDLFENLSENSLKGDLSNDSTSNIPLFSLFNTFSLVYRRTEKKNYRFLYPK